ncbi:non-ribosomal peptide synthase [Burkholderia pseudomallei]|nr:non-ribosomal peptide synthase [Burkholderia pseudomallei]CAJ3805516.1 non-ribosomal peptide synthase [Burkholderia pseudomallei]CAJ3909527.1 non-ribosomal peptide synthase [Burkholderia pseudomallei]CAJ4923044.1 non-ribosomal peptide synthase [Burkholderia pseudomallei]CAJ5164194.1 non-ribosomal peptide synthase [Burkholderia pseudomallei]
MGVFSITPLKNKNPALGEGLSAIWRSEWSAFHLRGAARRGAARQRLRKLEIAAPAPSFYFNTAAIAFATTSRLRVLSAATQIRPVLTA